MDLVIDYFFYRSSYDSYIFGLRFFLFTLCTYDFNPNKGKSAQKFEENSKLTGYSWLEMLFLQSFSIN